MKTGPSSSRSDRAAPPPLLNLEDVGFWYRGKTAILRDFSLASNEGEFIALLGPSGCGKTTVMNLVAGFLNPTSGTVRFNGRAVSGPNDSVAYMTQGDTLLPWRRVAANVRLPLELRGLSREQANAKVAAVLKLVHLENAADLYPAQLSGGMKRRALLARSMVYDPMMLLMDEPFAALDAQLRETMHKELLATIGSFNRSVLFVTHDIAESISLADRIVMLRGHPARIAEDIQVPFGKTRNLDDVRESSEYVALERYLRAGLAAA
ncbi:MAG: ABC transporter ATP-binding protein [Pigmentiphaga sp.]